MTFNVSRRSFRLRGGSVGRSMSDHGCGDMFGLLLGGEVAEPRQ